MHTNSTPAFLSPSSIAGCGCGHPRGLPHAGNHTSRHPSRETANSISPANEGDLPGVQPVPQVHCGLPGKREGEDQKRRGGLPQTKVYVIAMRKKVNHTYMYVCSASVHVCIPMCS